MSIYIAKKGRGFVHCVAWKEMVLAMRRYTDEKLAQIDAELEEQIKRLDTTAQETLSNVYRDIDENVPEVEASKYERVLEARTDLFQIFKRIPDDIPRVLDELRSIMDDCQKLLDSRPSRFSKLSEVPVTTKYSKKCPFFQAIIFGAYAAMSICVISWLVTL